MWEGILTDSISRLNSARLISNPVMFVVELSFFVVLYMALFPNTLPGLAHAADRMFYAEVAVILFVTVWFSTISDSSAEARSRATAEGLKKLEQESDARKIVEADGARKIEIIRSSTLKKGDLILIENGDQVPIDGEVLEGIAMVDESLLTGESAGVRKTRGIP